MIFSRLLLTTTCLVLFTSCTNQGDYGLVQAPAIIEPAASADPQTPAEQWQDVSNLEGLVSGYLRALIAEGVGDASEAARGYAEVAKANPENMDMLYRALSMQLASGDLPAAIKIADQLKAKDQQVTPTVQLLRVADAVKRNDFQAAQQTLTELRSQEDDLLSFEVLSAYLALAQGAEVEAQVEAIKNFPAAEGQETEKNYHIGRIYEQAGDQKTALQYYAQGYVLNPTYLPLIARLGNIYEHQGEFSKAVDLYKTFDEMKPSSALFAGAQQNAMAKKVGRKESFTPQSNVGEVMFAIANLMISEESFLAAEQFLQIARYLRPHDMYIPFYQGIIAEHEQDYTRAVAFYREIPPADGIGLAARLRTAQALSASGKNDEAVAVLADMVKRGEKVDLARQTIAEIHYNQKDYAKAVEYYNILLQNPPKEMTKREAALYFARGTAFERLKQFDKAQRDIEKSLSIFPDNAVALNYIGYMLVDLKLDQKRGKRYIEQALALKPYDGSIIDSMGWAYYHEGNYAEALNYLERAATLLPADPTVTEHLGDVYYKQGRLDEAKTQWLRALRLEPDEPAIRHNIEQKIQSLQVH
jgi:tetratricopeptide (TPR) repeat protein